MNSSMCTNKKSKKSLNVNFYDMKWTCASDKLKEAESTLAATTKNNNTQPYPSTK